jgi:hypothetical protein
MTDGRAEVHTPEYVCIFPQSVVRCMISPQSVVSHCSDSFRTSPEFHCSITVPEPPPPPPHSDYGPRAVQYLRKELHENFLLQYE